MLYIHLIRHGKKDGSDTDPQLTELGHKQAEQTAQCLKKFPIKKIIASPSLRTRQTASYISKIFSVPLEIDSRLKERIDFANFQGDRKEFFSEWFKTTHKRDFKPQAGDSSNNTGKKILELIQEIELPKGSHTVLVTHGGAIADFLRNISNDQELRALQYIFPEGLDYRIDECSITTLLKKNNGFQIINLHNTAHLI